MKRQPDASQPGCAGGTWLAWRERRPPMLPGGVIGGLTIATGPPPGMAGAFRAAQAFEEGVLHERRRQARG
jgi:hypothetical protein